MTFRIEDAMCERSTASLRVFSFTRQGSEIAQVLGRTPERQREIGDRFSPRNPASRIYDRTTCIFESGLPEEASIEDHLLSIIRFVETKKQEFDGLANDCEIDVLCSYSSEIGQGCIPLSRSMLRNLAGLGYDVAFCVYVS